MFSKKVLILLPDSIEKPMGGMGVYVQNIVKSFERHKNFKFFIIGSDTQERTVGNNFIYDKAETTQLPMGIQDGFINPVLYQSNIVARAIKMVKKPDLIHCNDWSTVQAASVLSNFWKVPFVFTIQLSLAGSISSEGAINPYQKLGFDSAMALEMFGVNNSDFNIFVSKSQTDAYRFLLNNNSAVVYNGIDLGEWKQVNKIEFPGSSDKLKLVYIGRYAGMKGIYNLLSAKITDNVDLIFIGDNKGGTGDIYDAMLDYCEKNDNSFYVGAKYGQEKVDYLLAADAMIVPSIYEPFGIVALEALASKSILISSYVGGMKEFLSEDFALNCGVTPEGISECLERFSKMAEDEKKSMIEKGLELCRRMTWDSQADKIKQIYEYVIKQKKRVKQ